MHSELAQAAEREGTSLNAYITQVLAASLSDVEPLHAAGGPSRFMRIAVIDRPRARGGRGPRRRSRC